jgi:Fic family protein
MDANVREWCRRQCEIQHATTDFDFSNMERAWTMAWKMNDQSIPIDIFSIRMLAGRIDPIANTGGRFRTGPAVFMDGGSAVAADLIGGALDYLLSNLRIHGLTPAEFYCELMWVHPFRDGNGRVGALIYNWLNGTLDNPVDPPEYS